MLNKASRNRGFVAIGGVKFRFKDSHLNSRA